MYKLCINQYLVLNQAHASQKLAHAWFLEIAFVHDVGMCACVYVHPRGYKLDSRDIESA